MYCTRCGAEIDEKARFCSQCGLALAENPYGTAPGATVRRLSRPIYNGKIAGVCAGFARYFDLDVTLTRIIALILLFWPVPGLGGIAYLVAWALMPKDVLPAPSPQPFTGPGPTTSPHMERF